MNPRSPRTAPVGRREILVLFLALGCSSTPGGEGTRLDASGGQGNAGTAPVGSGGAPASGAGGAPAAGAGGVVGPGSGGALAAGAGGGAGSAGAAGMADGGAGATGGAAGASAGGAGVPGSGGESAGGGGAAGATGGGAGSAGSDGGTAAGGASGSSNGGGSSGGAPAGCDWMNPEGRITLFDGTTLSGFQNSTTGGAAPWRIVDQTLEVVPANPSTNIETTMKFEDLCLHLEYQTPMYSANVTGQQRGNSGIYFKRSYEMQVLDSYGQPPMIDGCGAVYGISPPLEVACNMQLVWNTYEIEFKASRWSESGTKTENAVFVSARLNGTTVQRDVELDVSSTTAGQPDTRGPQALMLQDHGNPVRFRNIWVKVPRY